MFYVVTATTEVPERVIPSWMTAILQFTSDIINLMGDIVVIVQAYYYYYYNYYNNYHYYHHHHFFCKKSCKNHIGLLFPLQMEIKHPQQCWVHAAQVLYLESCLSGPTGETSSMWEQADFDGVSSEVVIKFHLNSTMVSNAKVWTCRFPLLSFQPMEVFACFLKDYPPLAERCFGLQAVKDMSLPAFLIQDGSFTCSSWLTPIHSIHTGMTVCNWNQHSQLTGVATSFQRKATPPH